jgi:thioredoxin-like negative regulator of GroEL
MMYNSFSILVVCFLGLLAALPSTMVSGADLEPTTFKQTVLNDDRVWMVEFYSAMCGGCQEFASTWERIEKAFSEGSSGGAIATGKINIDNKAGLKIAEELGVLDDGVPHVRLFKAKGDMTGTAIVKSKTIVLIVYSWCRRAYDTCMQLR